MDKSIVPMTQKGDAITFLVNNAQIRSVVHEGRNHYSVVDLVGLFSDTTQDPRQYWNDIKTSMVKEGFELSENIRQLRLRAKDGKMRLTDCGDIITIRRVIMSIPSVKAEPLRMYLAGKDDALLRYREMNVLNGSEWAADNIHQSLLKSGHAMTFKGNDPELKWWQR